MRDGWLRGGSDTTCAHKRDSVAHVLRVRDGVEHGPFGQRFVPNIDIEVGGDSNYLTPKADAEGRYRFALSSSHVALRARASGLLQPCSASAVTNTDTTLDIHLVSNAVLVASGIPPSMPLADAQVSGRVTERGRSIGGAIVNGSFKVGRRSHSEFATATDTSGRYVLCGVQDGTSIYAVTHGYYSQDSRVDLKSTSTYDLQLVPGEF